MSYRDKIISDNIAFCLRNERLLNEWERSFVEHVDKQVYDVTLRQFNRLAEVAARVAKVAVIGDEDTREE